MQTTIKQLIREVSDIALHHKQINSFYYGEPLSIIKGRKVNFTSLWMNISVSSFDEKKTTFNIELFCMDRVNKDDRNKTDVENTTSRILRDIYNIVRFSTRWQDFGELVQQVQNQKYYDYTADRVTGWGQTISFNVWNTDCFADLPMGDYDFNQTIPIDVCDVLAIVRNSDNDTLATKLVSDSDNIIDVPDITVTDSDGSTYQQASGTNVVCTPGGGSGDVEVNGVVYGQYTAPNTFDVLVYNRPSAGSLVGSLGTARWVIGQSPIQVNSTPLDSVSAEATYNLNVIDQNSNPIGAANGSNWVVNLPDTDGDVTVNGNAFGTYTAPTTFNFGLLDDDYNDYTALTIIGTDIFITPFFLYINFEDAIKYLQAQNVTLRIVDRNDVEIGGFSGSDWQVLNPLKGNFQANVGVLADYVMTTEDVGTYTTLTDDGSSGTVTILINGGALSLPYTAVAGDIVSASRSTNTAVGWFKLD